MMQLFLRRRYRVTGFLVEHYYFCVVAEVNLWLFEPIKLNHLCHQRIFIRLQMYVIVAHTRICSA